MIDSKPPQKHPPEKVANVFHNTSDTSLNTRCGSQLVNALIRLSHGRRVGTATERPPLAVHSNRLHTKSPHSRVQGPLPNKPPKRRLVAMDANGKGRKKRNQRWSATQRADGQTFPVGFLRSSPQTRTPPSTQIGTNNSSSSTTAPTLQLPSPPRRHVAFKPCGSRL